MGFATTACFFEERAKKARDPDQKRRLLEVVYRQLAGIAAGFPDGFSPSGMRGAGKNYAVWR
jgi:hypothetical protein